MFHRISALQFVAELEISKIFVGRGDLTDDEYLKMSQNHL